jgi:RimJ/RimL family protein N-acetyltransferase
VPDVLTRDSVLNGDPGRRPAAPGWPHEGTAPGLGFLDAGGIAFLIIDDEGRIAGECGTKAPPTPDGTVEIGYGLAAPSRGRGLGTAAVGELVRWLSGQADVRAIEAEVHTDNVASWRIVERLGFIAFGTIINGYRRYLLELAR